MSDEIKQYNLCQDCGVELDWLPDAGCWFCDNCCAHRDEVRPMVAASDYDTLRAERDALQAAGARGIQSRVPCCLSPGRSVVGACVDL